MLLPRQQHRMYRNISTMRLPGSTTILQPDYTTIPIHNTITIMKPALISTGIMRQVHTLSHQLRRQQLQQLQKHPRKYQQQKLPLQTQMVRRLRKQNRKISNHRTK